MASRLAVVTTRMAGRRADLVAIAGLTGVAVAYLLVFVVVADRSYFASSDNVDQGFALFQKLSAVLHDGHLPLWDRNSLAGRSFVGEAIAGAFYPMNIVWALLFGSASGIGVKQLEVLVIAHTLLASVGFYLIVRSCSMDRVAAFASSIVFAYSGAFASRAGAQTSIYFGFAWLPLSVWLAKRHLDGRGRRNAIVAGAALGMSVLAGHFQALSAGVLMILVLYASTPMLAQAVKWRERAVGLLALGGAAGIVALPQLMFTVPYLARAYRFVGDENPIPPGGKLDFDRWVTAYSGSPDSLLTLLHPLRFAAPDGNILWLGLGALAVLAVASALGGLDAFRRPLGALWRPVTCTLLISTLLFIGIWTFLPRLVYELPLFGNVRALARYAIVIDFCLCMLLAAALSSLVDRVRHLRPDRGRLIARSCAVVGGVVILNALYMELRPNRFGFERWWIAELALAGAVFLVVAVAAARPETELLGPALVVTLGLGAFANGHFLTRSEHSPEYPAHAYARTAVVDAVERMCRGHRTYFAADTERRNVGDVYRQIESTGGYGATLPETYRVLTMRGGTYDSLESRLLDVGCYVGRDRSAKPPFRRTFTDPRTGISVFVRSQASRVNTPQGDPLPARAVVNEDEHQRYEVALPRSEIVVLGQFVYPGWTLEVDGRQTDPQRYKVNGVQVFPMVKLGPGRHLLDYQYVARPFTWLR